MPLPKAQSDRARSARRARLWRVLLWSSLILGNVVLIAIAVSLFTAYGVVWSSGSPAADRVHTLGVKGGKINWQRFELAAPGTAPIFLRFTAGPATGGLWSPPPGSGVITTESWVKLPFWLPLLPFVFPAVVFVRQSYRASLRAKRGCCRACGYDLWGLEPKDGVVICPECGQKKGRGVSVPGGATPR